MLLPHPSLLCTHLHLLLLCSSAPSRLSPLPRPFLLAPHPAPTAPTQAGLLLLVHGEVTDPEVDFFDREKVFIETKLKPLLDQVRDGCTAAVLCGLHRCGPLLAPGCAAQLLAMLPTSPLLKPCWPPRPALPPHLDHRPPNTVHPALNTPTPLVCRCPSCGW